MQHTHYVLQVLYNSVVQITGVKNILRGLELQKFSAEVRRADIADWCFELLHFTR